MSAKLAPATTTTTTTTTALATDAAAAASGGGGRGGDGGGGPNFVEYDQAGWFVAEPYAAGDPSMIVVGAVFV